MKSVATMKDLGVLYSSDLSFSEHVSYAIIKAKRKLGFCMRCTSDFTRPSSIISLFEVTEKVTDFYWFRPIYPTLPIHGHLLLNMNSIN